MFDADKNTLLPDNRTTFERSYEEGLKALVKSDEVYSWISDPLKTKPELLDLIAKERGVNDWFFSDSEETKRAITAASYSVHQSSGTNSGILQALSAVDYSADVTHWKQVEGGKPYTVYVVAWGNSNQPVSKLQSDRLLERINHVKSLRDTIDFALAYAASTSIVIAAASPALSSVTTTDATASLWEMPMCTGRIQVSAAHVPVTSVATISSNAVINSPELHAEIGLRQTASELAISVTEIKATASNDMEVKEFSESSGYKVTIMEQGLAELISAKSKGLKGEIAAVAFGTESYNPAHNQTQLRDEVDRVDIGQYIDTGGSSLKMVTKTDNTKEYPVREIGFFLSSGTLLGVISAPGKILNYKTEKTALIQIFVLNLAALPTESITVVVGIENLNILIDEQMMSDAVAFARSQKSQTQHLFAYMKLAEKVHKMETENE